MKVTVCVDFGETTYDVSVLKISKSVSDQCMDDSTARMLALHGCID